MYDAALSRIFYFVRNFYDFSVCSLAELHIYLLNKILVKIACHKAPKNRQ